MRQFFSWGKTAPTVSGAALIAGAIWWLTSIVFTPTLTVLEERSADWAWRMAASSTRESRVILIDIDEASLQQLGPWPWSRQRVADLSDKLAAEGVDLQVLDIIFPASSSDDNRLANSLKKNNAVLAQTFAFDANTQASSGTPAAALPWAACPANIPVASGFIANDTAFSSLPIGHITPYIEQDGTLRRQPALICYQGKVYPALFVAALAQALSVRVSPPQEGTGLLGPAWQLSTPSLKNTGLPLDSQGLVRIPWTVQPDAFISLSAADVLAGRIPHNLLQNAWVVIGSSALGLNDRVATPFAGNTAGLVVHAQLLLGALEGILPVQPRFAAVISVVVALAGTLLLAILGRIHRKPVSILVLSGVALVTVLWLSKSLLLTQQGLWFNWVEPALYLLLFALSLGLLEYARDRLERDRLFSHLASYLPHPVAAALTQQDPSDAIDAKRCTITVLYADIRNFATYCETHPPEEATAVLHAFFSMVTRLVEENGGVVEFFQGDAVLAVWNNESNPASPGQALTTAASLLRESWQTLPSVEPSDIAPLVLGIGLETGMATVGSFGLARRRTHLAIGHPVTMAARLQEMTIELAHPILLGEGIAARLDTQRLVSQGFFLLEGMTTSSHIYAYPLKDCIEHAT